VVFLSSKVPQFDLKASFADSDSHKPIILLLSPGSDPLTAVKVSMLKLFFEAK
jgi:hypothetical protein